MKISARTLRKACGAALAVALVVATNTAAQAQANGYTYLQCNWRKDVDGSAGSTLFKIGNGEFDEYNPSYGTWINHCVRSFTDSQATCSLTDAQYYAGMIINRGTPNQLIWQWTINRVSGSYMREDSGQDYDAHSAGSCQATAAPAPLQRQF